jgi:hypothetical protein
VTNDGATILKAVYVDNPAAKVLVGERGAAAVRMNRLQQAGTKTAMAAVAPRCCAALRQTPRAAPRAVQTSQRLRTTRSGTAPPLWWCWRASCCARLSSWSTRRSTPCPSSQASAASGGGARQGGVGGRRGASACAGSPLRLRPRELSAPAPQAAPAPVLPHPTTPPPRPHTKRLPACPAGFREASAAALARLEAISFDNSHDAAAFRRDLINIARTTLSSKILTSGSHGAQAAASWQEAGVGSRAQRQPRRLPPACQPPSQPASHPHACSAAWGRSTTLAGLRALSGWPLTPRPPWACAPRRQGPLC